jgi:hypothetical protein
MKRTLVVVVVSRRHKANGLLSSILCYCIFRILVFLFIHLIYQQEGAYAAYACGKLRPGQTVLQIDDKHVRGMTNGMAILTLRQAYSNPETKTVLLVVKDP